MAERALFERYLSCHVCSETFRDPVSLSCKHSFCSSCLQQFWKDAKIKDCPVCKRKSSKDRPSINLSLKELADSFTKRKNNSSCETEIEKKKKKKEEVQFLKEEEESRLAALREEEEQKGKTISREMKRIEEQISSLSDSICAVEEELHKHNVSFLSSYKATQTRARAQSSLSDPQLLSGALIDVAKHLGNLNMKYTTVFGSESFSSGKHSWEVEVGDHPRWIVGLVKESVDKKVESISPEYGIWCLSHDSGEYTDVVCETVTVKKSLKRIRVQLDYDRGEVSFYDPENKTQICTHRETFIENIFPYFSLGEAELN
uniref:Uncharacterized protein n=1 Tax=Anabas testudineus TaxID=64144 RepID=A0A7N5ZVG6_ANATE